MPGNDWTEPNVCVDENIGLDLAGQPVIEPWAIPRCVRDVKVLGTGDTISPLFPETALPGRLLKNQRIGWRNQDPLPVMMRILVTRASRQWIVSNPNAIQFRDRWTYVVDVDDLTPTVPVTVSLYNSQCGSALDCGTNSVAEPNPGKLWNWADATCDEEWVGPIEPGEMFNLWYREYVWTPPPFSDNANKNKPEHKVLSPWTRIQLWTYPGQGNLVTG